MKIKFKPIVAQKTRTLIARGKLPHNNDGDTCQKF